MEPRPEPARVESVVEGVAQFGPGDADRRLAGVLAECKGTVYLIPSVGGQYT